MLRTVFMRPSHPPPSYACQCRFWIIFKIVGDIYAFCSRSLQKDGSASCFPLSALHCQMLPPPTFLLSRLLRFVTLQATWSMESAKSLLVLHSQTILCWSMSGHHDLGSWQMLPWRYRAKLLGVGWQWLILFLCAVCCVFVWCFEPIIFWGLYPVELFVRSC